MDWMPVSEKMPDPERSVIVAVTLKTASGEPSGVITVAEWVPRFSHTAYDYEGIDADYDEATDESYWPEGWYEWAYGADVIYRLSEPVTHWMPLPKPPGPGGTLTIMEREK